ncbi:MAG: hypothetical protein ABEK29_11430, partial [Bradymonadaceae bacterium]
MEALTDPTNPVARLQLWMLETRDLTRPQRDQYIRLLRRLRESHPDPNLRAYATRALAGQLRTHGNFEEADRLAGSLGWIGDWQFVGPLDGGSSPLEATLGPEKHLDLEGTYEGVRGETSFRPVPRLDGNGEVALDSLLSPRDGKVAYLVTWVKTDRARTVDVRFTADRPVKLFVNGESVSTVEDFEGRAFDNAIVQTPLAAGWNRLMVKTVGGDSWQVGVRLTSPEGRPLGDAVTTSYSSQKVGDIDIDTSKVETPRSPLDLRGLQPRARRLFWQGRRAARTGPYEREEKKARQFYEVADQNPLALYVGFLAQPDDFPNADDRQTLSELFETTDTGGSGLLWRRGIHRDDADENRAALSDFRNAIEREPTNRGAWMWLS